MQPPPQRSSYLCENPRISPAETAFFDTLPEATLICDLKGRICAANHAWRNDILQGREHSPSHISQTFSPESTQLIENAIKNFDSTTAVDLGQIDVVVDHMR